MHEELLELLIYISVLSAYIGIYIIYILHGYLVCVVFLLISWNLSYVCESALNGILAAYWWSGLY